MQFNSREHAVYFDYHPEGLDEGQRTLALPDIRVSDGELHHIAMSVFGADFTLFLDGEMRASLSLVAALEDGPGVLFLGRKLGDESRFEGKE